MDEDISRGASRTRAVLEATSELLSEVGFGALTVDLVAARAHASKATIYRRWSTKNDLVIAVVDQMTPLALDQATTSAAAESSSAESGAQTASAAEAPRAALLALALALRSVTVGDSGRILLALHVASRDDPRIRDAVEARLVVPQQLRVAQVLSTLADQGVVSAHADTALAGRVLSSLIIDRALADGVPLDEDEIALLVDQWLIPVLAPQVVGARTPGPPAGPG